MEFGRGKHFLSTFLVNARVSVHTMSSVLLTWMKFWIRQKIYLMILRMGQQQYIPI